MTPISGLGFSLNADNYMIRCNKCNVEKEDNHFATYWHSTQQKQRIRKECKDCFYKQRNERKRLKRKEDKLNKLSIPTEIIQPVVPELQPEPVIDYYDTTDYKKCIGCNEILPKSDFYKQGTDSRFNRCKECINKQNRIDRQEELEEQGGSKQISPKPNTYKDKFQKQQVFEFLPLLGWKFNEQAGIWYREGFKNPDGTFVFIQKGRKTKYKTITKEDGVEIFKLRDNGYKLGYIADKVGVTKGAVSNYLKKHEYKKQ